MIARALPPADRCPHSERARSIQETFHSRTSLTPTFHHRIGRTLAYRTRFPLLLLPACKCSGDQLLDPSAIESWSLRILSYYFSLQQYSYCPRLIHFKLRLISPRPRPPPPPAVLTRHTSWSETFQLWSRCLNECSGLSLESRSTLPTHSMYCVWWSPTIHILDVTVLAAISWSWQT
jgi:hypothetical protein